METIGDAYCVAGGLHKDSPTHAVQIALMALKMMYLSDEVTTPMGEAIRVSTAHTCVRHHACLCYLLSVIVGFYTV